MTNTLNIWYYFIYDIVNGKLVVSMSKFVTLTLIKGIKNSLTL